MKLDFKERVMRLARQSCELNCWKWPDDLDGESLGFDECNCYQKHEAIRPAMEKIEREIEEITHLPAWYTVNYHWNCFFRDDPLTPQQWIEWVLFGKVGTSYMKEKGRYGFCTTKLD